MLISHEKILEIVRERVNNKYCAPDDAQINERVGREENFEIRTIGDLGQLFQKIEIDVSRGGVGIPGGGTAGFTNLDIATVFVSSATWADEFDPQNVSLPDDEKSEVQKRAERLIAKFNAGLAAETDAANEWGSYIETAWETWVKARIGRINQKVGSSFSPAWIYRLWNTYRGRLGWPAPDDATEGSSVSKSDYMGELESSNVSSTDGMTLSAWRAAGGTVRDIIKFIEWIEGVPIISPELYGRPTAPRWPLPGTEGWDAALSAAGARRTRERNVAFAKEIIISGKEITLPGSNGERADMSNFGITFDVYANGDIVISASDAENIAQNIQNLVWAASYSGPSGATPAGGTFRDEDATGMVQPALVQSSVALTVFLVHCWIGSDAASRESAYIANSSKLTEIRTEAIENPGRNASARADFWSYGTWNKSRPGGPNQEKSVSVFRPDIQALDSALNSSSGFNSSTISNHEYQAASKAQWITGIINRAIESSGHLTLIGGSSDALSDVYTAVKVSQFAYSAAQQRATQSGGWNTLYSFLGGANWLSNQAERVLQGFQQGVIEREQQR